MRYLTLSAVVLCLVIGATAAFANANTDSVAFQGSLSDASNNPVPDGVKDLILTIWTDSVGGTMLHSETVVITTTNGLFTTCLGCGSSSFPGIFNGQTLFLQQQVAGSPPMVPRTRLRSATNALSSSSVHAEALNGLARSRGMVVSRPGTVHPHSRLHLDADDDGDGVPTYLVLDSVSTDGSSRVMTKDSDDDGTSDGDISFSISPTTSSVAIKQKGTGADKDRVVIQTTTIGLNPGTSMVMSRDEDDDGVMDRDITTETDDAGARLAIKTKGTSAKRLSAGGDCDDTDATLHTDCDDDNDGVMESSMSSSSSSDGSSIALEARGTIGGLMGPRMSTNLSVSRLIPSTSWEQDIDFDNDGTSETSMISTASSSSAERRVRSYGIGSSGNDGVEVTLLCTPDSAVETSHVRKNGAIIAADFDYKATSRLSRSSSLDSDGNGVPEQEIEQVILPTSSNVAIKTRGTGADKNRTAGSSCDDSSAVDYLDIDDDADGVSEAYAVSSVSSVAGAGGGAAAASYAATGRWYTDSDDDGVPEGDIESSVTPIVSSVAIKTKGTGADPNRVVITSTTDTSSAVSVHSVDLDGDGVADRSITEQCDDGDASISIDEPGVHITMARKGWDGTIKGSLRIDNGTDLRAEIDGNGNGYLKSSLGIDVTSPSHPIEHSSGAHLTVGGDWINASDENLKENFRSVNGEELLEKIEELEIKEWNYKNQGDEVKHIGPTAQDFKETFGLGENDKSISTIDPSGIALAAIKQLKKENDELKKKVEELTSLKSEIEQLKKLMADRK